MSTPGCSSPSLFSLAAKPLATLGPFELQCHFHSLFGCTHDILTVATPFNCHTSLSPWTCHFSSYHFFGEKICQMCVRAVLLVLYFWPFQCVAIPVCALLGLGSGHYPERSHGWTPTIPLTFLVLVILHPTWAQHVMPSLPWRNWMHAEGRALIFPHKPFNFLKKVNVHQHSLT